jgi:hypothetical protein
MGTSVVLVKQFGNPTFNSLRVSGSIFFTGSLNISGSVTATSNLVVSGSSTFANNIVLSNSTSNRITWGTTGVAAPSLNSYSTGVKLVLYDNVGASSAGYTIGIDNSTMFYTVDNTSAQFKWFGSTTLAATLSGTGAFTAVGNVTAFSDARLKTNIKTIDNALSKVLALRGVTYNRIDLEDKSEQIGVIAQEIKEILPQVVQENEGHYSVAYGNIVGVLIEAIKEQQAQIEELKSRL